MRVLPARNCCADVEKVVDILKAEELPKKAVFCRCWRSGKVSPVGWEWGGAGGDGYTPASQLCSATFSGQTSVPAHI